MKEREADKTFGGILADEMVRVARLGLRVR
jgi:hypothetical protein